MNDKMKIGEHKIPVWELSDGHVDSVAMNNKRICSPLTRLTGSEWAKAVRPEQIRLLKPYRQKGN